MELMLAKPIEELIPQAIVWNNAEILAEVKTAMAKYDGRIYTADQIAEAKQDKSTLNNWVKALDKARIEYHKAYEEPYDVFKAQIDEITEEVKKASRQIDEQVKVYEEKKKAEKREKIEELYDAVFADIKDSVSLDAIFDDRWLNVSVVLSNVEKYLKARHDKILSDIEVIKGLNNPNEKLLLADYLQLLDLSAVLAAEKERQARLEKANKIVEEKPSAKKTIDAASGKVYYLRFNVAVTREQAVALKQFLQNNKIIYEQI